MKKYHLVLKELRQHASAERAKAAIWYFKAGKGAYGEGDRFLGVPVPAQRQIARLFASLFRPEELKPLLQSPYHEMRATALFILIRNLNKATDVTEEKKWVKCYLDHLPFVNNWDLVDSSAPHILGKWLEQRNRAILYRFARSKNLWKNRIAMLTTLAFIRKKDWVDMLQLATIFIDHPHDLMHKATGWMLREAWKLNPTLIERFLLQHAAAMPRTMLRYAIEKMHPTDRLRWMKMKQGKKSLAK
ncbi:MAG: DNA alkylation repair protein [Bacteroidota bacterium]